MAESESDPDNLLVAYSNPSYDWVSQNSGDKQPPLPKNAMKFGETEGTQYYVGRSKVRNDETSGSGCRKNDDQHYEYFSRQGTPVYIHVKFEVLVPKALSFKWSQEISTDDKFDEAKSLAPGEVAFASGTNKAIGDYYWFPVQTTDGNESVGGVVSQWGTPMFFGRKRGWMPKTYRVLCFDF